MQEARTAHAHAYRVKHLEGQAEIWHRVIRLTEYVTAVRGHAASLPPGQEKTEVEAWIAFADAAPSTPHRNRLSAETPPLHLRACVGSALG